MSVETTTISKSTRVEKIKDIVSNILEIEPAEMTDTSLFKEDHNADSLRAIEILASLEKEFKVEIPQTELSNMVSLAAVYDVVKTAGNWID